MVLNCRVPLILRRVPKKGFEVVGSCYVHGFTAGEGLLGRLSPPWTLQFLYDDSGQLVPSFHNQLTSLSTPDDPRLKVLKQRSELLRDIQGPHDSSISIRQHENGSSANDGTRVHLESLQKHGIRLEKVRLV